MKYKINDRVWWAKWEQEHQLVECPDCGGTGRVRCVLHDEDMVSVDCPRCCVGFDPPRGLLHVWNRTASAEKIIITGLEVSPDGIYYGCEGGYRIPEDRLFCDEDSALACAKSMAETANAEEIAAIAKKERDTKSWAWNASYHRKQIKDLKKQLEYHRAKLAVAAVKKRDPKE